MKIPRIAVLKGIGWTVGTFGLGQLSRLVMIVVISRFLAPEIFGIMTIVNSLRTGADLLSDLGIGQNIVQNKNADNPEFYNTAWTLQLIRGPLLFLIFSAAALPLATLYEIPSLTFILPLAALFFIFTAFSSISVFLIQRRLQFAKLNSFDLMIEFISALAHIILVYLNPTIWSLVISGLVAPAARMITSYFLLSDLRHHLYVSKQYAWQIFSFGKWILIASLAYFLSLNFDRLYLGKVAPLALLGVYGIARSLSDPIGNLAGRLGSYIVFPIFASRSDTARDQLRMQVVSIRMKFLVVAAVGLSLFVAVADLPVKILYDHRYQEAAWMLPIMAIGLWFSIICTMNESMLLGFGKAHYSAIANGIKFVFLLIALPVSFMKSGILGAVIVIAVSDLPRYVAILFGQIRQRFSFVAQDLSSTLIMFALILASGWLRYQAGFGTSFDDVPVGSLTWGHADAAVRIR